jgi:hypothetical protein
MSFHKAYDILAVHGACIVEDFFSPFNHDPKCTDVHPLFTCDAQQANYILKSKTNRREVFNSVMMHSKTSTYKTVIPPKSTKTSFRPDGIRMRLEMDTCDVNKAAMSAYQYQMDLLLQNIFKNGDYEKKSPVNWKTKMQNIVGGTEHQHPHADLGRPHEYRDQDTFPFTATHGFGMHTYQLWLLPNAHADIKYGFLNTFSATSLLLLRGDFVHAGGISKEPRCHMEFFPLPTAGMVHGHEHHYWLEDNLSENEIGRTFETSFLWQGPQFPFAYPLASYKPNSMGRMRTVLSYPPYLTQQIVEQQKTQEGESLCKQAADQRF